jgi:hypothetical protein
MTSLLAGCRAFVRRGEAASSPSAPAPGAACCEGVAELYAVAADSADNWRSVCGCMAGLVRRYSSNASAIALLPVLCGVLPPAAGRAAGDTLTYCTRYGASLSSFTESKTCTSGDRQYTNVLAALLDLEAMASWPCKSGNC